MAGRTRRRNTGPAAALSRLSRIAGAGSRVPLRSRLWNRPALFVGRARELSAFEAARERASVVVVCGPGGIGKTSLVLEALHGPGAAARRAVSVAVSAGDRSGEQAVQEILSALGEMAGARGLAPGLLRDRQDLLATCIDLADALDAWVVIDDLHHGEGPLLEELLTCALAYARRGRFFATSRIVPTAQALAAQTLVLDAMPSDDLLELALRAAPDLSEREAAAIARQAGGSPFWLWQSLALKRTAREAVGRALVSDLEPAVGAWVLALAHLDVPLPLAALGALGVPAPVPKALDRVVRRGLVEASPAGVRLHAVARAALSSEDSTAVARALAVAEPPTLRLEAVRLALAAGHADDAARILARTTDDALRAGLGPRLWQVLAEVREERFRAAKLACAVDLGGGDAVDWALGIAAPDRPEERLAWLTVQGRAGRLEEAARGAEALATELESVDRSQAAEAMLVAVRARVTRGEGQTAVELAQTLRSLAAAADRADLVAASEAWTARACTFTGEHRRALAIANDLGGRAGRGADAVESEIDTQRAVVYANLGRQRSAREALERAGASGFVSAEQLGARERLARRALDHLEAGRLADARVLLDELAPLARRSGELFAFACMNELRYAAARGDLPAAWRHLSRLEEAVRASGSGYWGSWLATPRHYLGVLGALAYDAEASAAPDDFPLSRAAAALHEVVSTGRTERLDREPPTDVTDAAVVLALARSFAALLAEDLRRAREAAGEALALASGEGLALWEADARLALAEAELACGGEGLSAAVDDLDALTRTWAPTRYGAEVAWYRALATGPTAAAASWGTLAESSRSGAAARRSRALLGAATPLDRIDSRIVARAKLLLGVESLPRAVATPRAGLGLDTRRGRVLLPRGESVDLSGRPMLMRLLTALFEAGGEASKEALVGAVWGISEYHPLRDDKRLQVAVRRLRVLLEPGAGDPRVVETTEQGYRLAAGLPVYRAV